MIRALCKANLHEGQMRKQAVGIKGGLVRQLHVSSRKGQVNEKKSKLDGATDRKYYYEMPGNQLNPHSYFYRVLAVPYIKFCGVIIATYYGMSGLWEYLDSRDRRKSDLL